jgi:sigma-E factor negative regulatory protein RseA
MSQKFENLSALIDGEHITSSSSNSHILDAVRNDVDLQLKWKSYHLIRDGLRQELPVNIHFDIADKVAQALEAEPAILAPKKTWRNIPLVINIGVQQINQADVNQPFNAAPPIPGIQGGLSPVSFDQVRNVPDSDGVEQRRRINAYMTDHKQQLRFKTMQISNDESTMLEPNVKNAIKNKKAQPDIVENIPQ